VESHHSHQRSQMIVFCLCHWPGHPHEPVKQKLPPLTLQGNHFDTHSSPCHNSHRVFISMITIVTEYAPLNSQSCNANSVHLEYHHCKISWVLGCPTKHPPIMQNLVHNPLNASTPVFMAKRHPA